MSEKKKIIAGACAIALFLAGAAAGAAAAALGWVRIPGAAVVRAPAGFSESLYKMAELAGAVEERAKNPPSQEELGDAAVEGMLGALGDGWAEYFPKESFAAFEGSVEGTASSSAYLSEKDGVPVLSVRLFSGTAPDEIRGILREIGDRPYVLDLSACGGGDMEPLLEAVSLMWEEEARFGETEGRGGREQLRAGGAAGAKAPSAVAVSKTTASAAEFAALFFSDMGVPLAGERTFGKGDIQQVVAFSDGTGAKFTTKRFYSPSGRTPADGGVAPDREAPAGQAASAAAELVPGE